MTSKATNESEVTGVRIGELARRTGVSTRSLRYYEEQGLLQPERSPRAQRHYGDDAVDRVSLLRRLYDAGLNSATIATLLPCVDTPSAATTGETIATMRREHDRLAQQIAGLVAAHDQLAYLIRNAEDYHRDQDTPTASNLTNT